MARANENGVGTGIKGYGKREIWTLPPPHPTLPPYFTHTQRGAQGYSLLKWLGEEQGRFSFRP